MVDASSGGIVARACSFTPSYIRLTPRATRFLRSKWPGHFDIEWPNGHERRRFGSHHSGLRGSCMESTTRPFTAVILLRLERVPFALRAPSTSSPSISRSSSREPGRGLPQLHRQPDLARRGLAAIRQALPGPVTAEMMDAYLDRSFAVYRGVPELIEWCLGQGILFMLNTTGDDRLFPAGVRQGAAAAGAGAVRQPAGPLPGRPATRRPSWS